MCETNKNMEELHRNASSTAVTVFLEVSVSCQLNDTEAVNFTLYGHSNRSSLYLQTPDEQEDQDGDDADQGEAFYCCLPPIPTSNSANQSRCLLLIANQTVLSETGRLPWKWADKGGWCRFRVTCLVLLGVFFLVVVTVVIGKIYVGARLNKKPIVHPIAYYSATQQIKGTPYRSNRLQSLSGLSPIAEIESQDDNKNPLNGYAENTSSSLPSSYLLPHRRAGVLTGAQQKEHRNGLKAHKARK
ncbi:uncharacterized protein V3H82_002292 isoform 2-T2 [Fundulus diaphanus]